MNRIWETGFFKAGLVCVLPLVLLLSTGASAETFDVSAELSEQESYVRQSAVYSVRIETDQSLEAADVSLPSVDGGVFTRLDDEWTTRAIPGKRGRYLNERRYLFTPLRAGQIEIPPAKVKVLTAAAQQAYAQPWQQQPYGYPNYGYPVYGQQPTQEQQTNPAPRKRELSTQAIRLNVTGLVGTAARLLPLHEMRLEGQLQSVGAPRVGEPVAVTITLTGIGAAGDALPSIFDALQANNDNSDFKIYADRPRLDTRFDDRLQAVVGQRTETLTLVPTRTGSMQLPIVEIPYWNTITGTQDVARLATRPLRVESGGVGTAAVPAAPESAAKGQKRVPLHTSSEDVRGFWLPVGGALLAAFLIGWRMGAGHRRQKRQLAKGEQPQPSPAPSPSPLKALTPMVERSRRLVAKALPSTWRSHLADGASAVLSGANRILPQRVRIWTCMRCVQRESEPSGICRVLRRFASDCLGLPENSPLQSIGKAVASRRPTTETSSYLNLFGQLDNAVYGSGGAQFDLNAWKRDFQKTFGRLVRGRRKKAGGRGGSGLPELNPR